MIYFPRMYRLYGTNLKKQKKNQTTPTQKKMKLKKVSKMIQQFRELIWGLRYDSRGTW